MRYQKEIEAILKISEEFGSKVLTQNVLGQVMWKQLEEGTLHHLAKNLQLSVLYSSITVKKPDFTQEIQKRNDNLRAKFSDFSAPEKTLWAKVQKAIQPNLEDSSQDT